MTLDVADVLNIFLAGSNFTCSLVHLADERKLAAICSIVIAASCLAVALAGAK